jgi:hypothetical protein
MALPSMTPFPDVFNRWNSHMILLCVDEETYLLQPQNQLDWSYTLKKISGAKWRVQGLKLAYYDPEETCDDVYQYDNGRWHLISLASNELPQLNR